MVKIGNIYVGFKWGDGKKGKKPLRHPRVKRVLNV
jgi:hypothetical protein